MSWDEAFSRRYNEWSAHMTADIAFYVAVAREATGPIVELAIGSGRVAIAVAQATGRKVIGVDTTASRRRRPGASRWRGDGTSLHERRRGELFTHLI